MKKTISIHIKGFPFIIEEIAYTRLENYLKRLKAALHGQEGAEEIIEDIEIRIAELLNGKTTQFKQVIDDNDIVDVLNTLGDPSDYTDNDEPSYSEQTNYSKEQTNERRLYRDSESGYIGGVCSGLANYFNMDPTIIRLIWAGALLIGGVGFFLYIILWIIIPKANSSIDRLRMKGKPINVDTVKEEVERAAKNVSEKSRNFANQVKNDDRIKQGVSTVRNIIRSIVGVILLVIGIASLITLITFVFGTPQFIPASSEDGFLSVSALAELVFNDAVDHRLAWISFYVCSISFVTFFLLGGFVTLFNMKNKWYRYINLLLIFTGIIGFSIGMIVASRTGRDFSTRGEIEKEIATVNSDTLTILTKVGEPLKNTDYKVRSSNLWHTYIGKKNISEYGISIQYYTSKDSLYHVILKKGAHSHTLNAAVTRAKNIEYTYEVSNDTIILPAHFNYPTSDKFRSQQVTIHLYIPKGKTALIEGQEINLSKPIVEEDEYDFYDDQQRGKIRGDGTYSHRD